MNFYKKPSNNKVKNFWVEDYNPTERKFFLSLGFKETIYEEIANKCGVKNYLSFRGSELLGFWSEEESKKIYEAVMKRFNLKRIIVEIRHSEE